MAEGWTGLEIIILYRSSNPQSNTREPSKVHEGQDEDEEENCILETGRKKNDSNLLIHGHAYQFVVKAKRDVMLHSSFHFLLPQSVPQALSIAWKSLSFNFFL